MKGTSLGLTVLLMLFSFNVLAQTESASEEQPLDFSTLTLEQVIPFALEHAPAIKEAELTVALAELDLKSTQFWRRIIPSLTVHQGYDPAFGESRIGLGLSFNFTRLFDESDLAKAAKLKWFNANLYRRTVKNQVIRSTTKSYYDFIAAQRQAGLLEEQLSTQLKLSELEKRQFESGQATLASVLSTMQSIATTQLSLLKAQADVQVQELSLKQEIGWEQAN